MSVADVSLTEPSEPGATVPHGAVAKLNRANRRRWSAVVYSMIPIGDATNSSDIDLSSGSLTFLPGETEKKIPGNVKGDALDEDDDNAERVRIVLADASGADIISPDSFVDIADDPADLPPTMSIGDQPPIGEEDDDHIVMLAVTLSAPSGRQVSVAYATQNGTAVAPSDYTAASGTVIIPPGDIAAAIPVKIIGDTTGGEGALETFTVVLSEPGNATLADAEGTVTVADDD